MNIKYLPIDFKINFINDVQVDTDPLFILRSMLGKNLHSMCCISRQSKCGECMYNKTCVYTFLFETILAQDNELLPGTNRASHPFSFSSKKNQWKKTLSEYEFSITLLGKAIEYLPYIYAAFVKTGKEGIFKSRTPFVITNVLVNGKNILIDEEHIDTNYEILDWKGIYQNKAIENKIEKNEILIDLQSPLRFKCNGKYSTDFLASDFMKCLYRRARTLCTLYGTWEDEFNKYIPSEDIIIDDKRIRWVDNRHYSARQKKAMELGGVVGSFKLCGTFTDFELAIMELNKIANAGKNTNFGLGQIDFWKREK